MKTWICALLCVMLIIPTGIFSNASQSVNKILYTNNGSKTNIIEGTKAGLSAETVDAPFAGCEKAVRIYGTAATGLTYSCGLGYFATSSSTASADSIVLELDVCTNGGGLGVRMLQKNATAKSNVELLDVAGTELSYRRWYHVAVQFDADGEGQSYTVWINDRIKEQGSLQEAGSGLEWLRIQPLAEKGDALDLYMTNVQLYIGSYTPLTASSVIAKAPLTMQGNVLYFTRDMSASDVVNALSINQGSCTGIFLPDMQTPRTGKAKSGDVVCIRSDSGIYSYYTLQVDNREYALTSGVYTVDTVSNRICGITPGTTAEKLLQYLSSQKADILLTDSMGNQVEAGEFVDGNMRIGVYEGDNLLKSFKPEFSYGFNWDFDKHMPRNENFIQMSQAYVYMQKSGLSLQMTPKSGDYCAVSSQVKTSSNCDVCSFSLLLPEGAEMKLIMGEIPLLEIASDNTVVLFGNTFADFTFRRGTWTDCTIIMDHNAKYAELWTGGECKAKAGTGALPEGGNLELGICGAGIMGYLDDFMFYPVADRNYARLMSIPCEADSLRDIAIDCADKTLFDAYFSVNNGGKSDAVTVDDGALKLTAAPGGSAYIYNTQGLSFNKKIYISFSINAVSLNQSQFTALLRDTINNTTNGAIRFLKVKDGTITYLPDCTDVMVEESLPEGDAVFCAVFDADGDSLEIYRDGVCMFSTSELSMLNNSRWKAFGWSKVACRLNLQGSKNQPAEGDSIRIGHVIVTEKNLTGDAPVVFAPLYMKDGKKMSAPVSGCAMYQTVYTPKATDTALRSYLAQYRSNQLLHARVSDASELKAGECKTFYLPVGATDANTFFRSYIWDEGLRPCDNAVNSIRIPKQMESPEQLRSYVNAEHPYVAVKSDSFEELKNSFNPLRISWKNSLLAGANALLSTDYINPTIYNSQGNMVANPYYIGPQTYDGKRCNAGSRMLNQVSLLAFAYGVSGDEQYAQAVWERLKHTAAPAGENEETLFADWNPGHFLDVAAMAYAYAIGYDWCYSYYSENQKASVENTLEQYAFAPYLSRFCGSADAKAEHNRNLVCNGGILMAAAAVYDRNPDYYGDIVYTAMENMNYAMGSFNPDGAWLEGSDYWDYSLKYLIPSIQTLQTLYGTDFGLMDYDGMKATAFFPFAVQGPMGTNDFHDSSVSFSLTGSEALFYLADALNMPWLNGVKLKEMKRYNRSETVFDALWYNEAPYQEAELPLNQYLQGAELVSLQSSLFDSDAAWASFHGGVTDGSHTHIDGGAFVYDYNGVRWACELPHEDYNIGGYSSGTQSKNTYYRVRAEGHNTLVIDPDTTPGQDTDSYLTISDYDLDAKNPWAIMDMTDAYKGKAYKVLRKMELKPSDGELLIEDAICLKESGSVYWFMHTQADAKLKPDGRSVLLTKGGKTMELTVASSHEAKVEVVPAVRMTSSGEPYAGTESSNDGYRKVQILICGEGDIKLSVTIRPYTENN